MRKATYPRGQVIGEADALLYQVLCTPIADANPNGVTIDPATYARHSGASIAEAEHVLQHIASTESQACDQLLASGVEPNFTLEQAQVYDCIVAIRGQERVPTRQLVRHHATSIAASALRPEEGSEPIVYAQDATLRPRIVSPSPKVHALLWLDRMDAVAPAPGFLDQRIAFLKSAKDTMGRAAVAMEDLRKSPTRSRPNLLSQVTAKSALNLAG